jgi:hypothetical protein
MACLTRDSWGPRKDESGVLCTDSAEVIGLVAKREMVTGAWKFSAVGRFGGDEMRRDEVRWSLRSRSINFKYSSLGAVADL